MKVGDYVRTKEYGFIKVKSFYYNEDLIHILDENNDEYDFSKELVNNFKSSPNILELLEEHDFIKIEYYSLRYDERVERIFEVYYKDNKFTTLKNAYCDFMLNNNEFNDSDKELEPIIKSIVTHQQFSQIEYRIGE